jgi:uncharacterized protein YqeY
MGVPNIITQMNELMQRLQAEYRDALRARDTEKVSTLRLLFARAKNAAIEQRVEEVDEPALQRLIQKEVKEREESVEQFRRGGRTELVERDEHALALLRGYLPAELSDDEIREVVRRVIAETGAAGKAGMGKVMRPVMAELRGQADGQRVNRIVLEELGS